MFIGFKTQLTIDVSIMNQVVNTYCVGAPPWFNPFFESNSQIILMLHVYIYIIIIIIIIIMIYIYIHMISYSSITSPCLHHVSCLKSPKPWHPSTLLSNRRRSARTSCWRCWKPMPPRRTRTTSWCPVCAGPWCRWLKPWIRSMMPGGGEPFLAFF